MSERKCVITPASEIPSAPPLPIGDAARAANEAIAELIASAEPIDEPARVTLREAQRVARRLGGRAPAARKAE